ncbi:MAG: exonuclease SbcCD subunit D [Erysipelotrichaceae bacterium]|nr:exonuclease SbcCD subunit D [Erysipelotrichaceae bacterium]
MEFVHIGDLHLGKILCQRSFLKQQEIVLFKLLDYIETQKIPVLVIAGDVYDRLVPPIEAVSLFNRFLEKAILELKLKVLIISGNHDSYERLQFASSILKQQGLVISSILSKEIETFEYEDVVFHLLPFIKPSQVNDLYEEANVKTYHEAIATVLKHHSIDTSKKNVMVTHQFVARYNEEVIESESEAILSVGGSEVIDVSLFDDYDYVALGHLHAPQKIGRETVRYSGSLLRYSFDEVKQNKSVCKVDMSDKEHIQISLIEFLPDITLNKYKGELNEFLNSNNQIVKNSQDYIFFELTDTTLKPQAMDQLRLIYPNVLQINYVNLNKEEASLHDFKLRKIDDRTIFNEFYQLIRNQPLNTNQIEIINDLLEKMEGDQ